MSPVWTNAINHAKTVTDNVIQEHAWIGVIMSGLPAKSAATNTVHVTANVQTDVPVMLSMIVVIRHSVVKISVQIQTDPIRIVLKIMLMMLSDALAIA